MTRTRLLAIVSGLIAALAMPAASAAPAAAPAIRGVWRNPYRTVVVRIEECGTQLCGVVVGATSEAVTDARDSGYPNLVGMELMRDYRADRPDHWVGTVFVPDLGHSFSSHI